MKYTNNILKVVSLREKQTRKVGQMDILHSDKRLSKQMWSDFTAHFKSSTTVGSYYSDITEACNYLEKNFIDVCPSDVKILFDWFSHRVETGEIKPATMAKKFREYHSLSQYLCENREKYELQDDYEDFFYIYLPFVAKQEKFAKAIPIEEIDKLFHAAQTDRMVYLIFMLLFRTGLSSTELIHIKLQDIEQYADGIYVWIQNRKEACYLTEDVVEVLNEYINQREDYEYLFYNRSGRSLNTMYISRMMKKYTIIAGIPPYSAEALRNSCGFTMYAYGAKDKQVARQLGITQMQIKRYDDLRYKDNIQRQAQNLVKVKVEPPV